jgi:hypothetical protein
MKININANVYIYIQTQKDTHVNKYTEDGKQ